MQQHLSTIGVSLIVAGFALAVVAVVLLLRSRRLKGSGGAVILIGPIPIILGSDRRITILMVGLLIVLMFFFVAGFYGINP